MAMNKKEEKEIKTLKRWFWLAMTLLLTISVGWGLFYYWQASYRSREHNFEIQLYKKDIALYQKDMEALQKAFNNINDKEDDAYQVPVTAYIYAPDVKVTPFNEFLPDIYPFPRTHYNKITQLFSIRKHPITGQVSFHHGVDLLTTYQGIVIATASGTVVESDYDRLYGNYIVIDHGQYFTLYAHLLERYFYKGQLIKKGEILGRMGDTGFSEGAHVHYEVFRKEKNEDGKEQIVYLDPLTGSGETKFVGIMGYLHLDYIAGINDILMQSEKLVQ